MKIPFNKRIMQGTRAQAMVEFALVLMILMVVLVGILEVGRLLFIYAAVNNASREAARYASAIGVDDSGNAKYQYCDGIRSMAQRSAFFTPLTISISYDHGPGTGSYDTCDGSVDTGVVVNAGSTFDRVQVQVSAQYDPMVSLIPIDSRTITSSSARTILGYVDLDLLTSTSPNTPVPTIPTTSGTGVPSPTPTDTATATPTSTATSSGFVVTMTPLPSSTPTLIPTTTSTATSTPTATSTATPTGTSTPSSSCSTITASNISVIDGTNVISMTITNPYTEVTVSDIRLIWNKDGGGGSLKTLTLDKVNLGTTFWSGLSNSSGVITLTPVSILTLPGNNAKSTITFTFIESYEASSMSGTTITINLSTPGCSAITSTVN